VNFSCRFKEYESRDADFAHDLRKPARNHWTFAQFTSRARMRIARSPRKIRVLAKVYFMTLIKSP